MEWRRVMVELEANLYPVPVPKLFKLPKGEVEFKEFSDGERKLEISLWGLKVQDGCNTSVYLNGEEIVEVQIQRGRGKLELSSNEVSSMTEINYGDILEICDNGKVLLEGTFKPDD